MDILSKSATICYLEDFTESAKKLHSFWVWTEGHPHKLGHILPRFYSNPTDVASLIEGYEEWGNYKSVPADSFYTSEPEYHFDPEKRNFSGHIYLSVEDDLRKMRPMAGMPHPSAFSRLLKDTESKSAYVYYWDGSKWWGWSRETVGDMAGVLSA